MARKQQSSATTAAERTVLDALGGGLVGALGSLQEAQAAKDNSGTVTAAAQVRADEVLRQAGEHAKQIMAEADAEVAALTDSYADAWAAAVAAGWAPAQLRGMGYTRARRSTESAPSAVPEVPAAPSVVEQAQPSPSPQEIAGSGDESGLALRAG